MSEKKLYAKVEFFNMGQSAGSYICEQRNALQVIADGFYLADGDAYTISGVEMTQEEIDALPEFVGF